MQEKPENSSFRPNKYMKLLAISSQLTATVLGFAMIGYFLDQYFDIEKNYYTLSFTLLGVILGLYLLYKQVRKLGE
ncbi:MAG: AtpZ/AtpI family protein [Flavobacteriaceae bacterium]|nr:AtpZ/AtpI family protein [Flavobacteriaceae bacterium]